jgi:DNA-binding PadR family transcriptional regulator
MTVRVTRKVERLLEVLLAVHAAREVTGKPYRMASRKIMKRARISGPHFFAIIRDLEVAGYVEAEIEVLPEGVHRPRSTYFHLTESGVTWAKSIRDRPLLQRILRKGRT